MFKTMVLLVLFQILCFSQHNEEKYELLSIQDVEFSKSSSSGYFLLVFGSMTSTSESNVYYYFYIRTPNGIKAIKLESTGQVFLHETDGFSLYKIKYSSGHGKYWKCFEEHRANNYHNVEHHLYLPKGTIQFQSKIDMK